MVLADLVWDFPEPRPLHTEDGFRAIGRPAYEKDGSEAHWHSWWGMLIAVFRGFGFSAALYERTRRWAASGS